MGKCIKMNTNKPMFDPVVLEIACGSLISIVLFLSIYPVHIPVNVAFIKGRGEATGPVPSIH